MANVTELKHIVYDTRTLAEAIATGGNKAIVTNQMCIPSDTNVLIYNTANSGFFETLVRSYDQNMSTVYLAVPFINDDSKVVVTDNTKLKFNPDGNSLSIGDVGINEHYLVGVIQTPNSDCAFLALSETQTSISNASIKLGFEESVIRNDTFTIKNYDDDRTLFNISGSEIEGNPGDYFDLTHLFRNIITTQDFTIRCDRTSETYGSQSQIQITGGEGDETHDPISRISTYSNKFSTIHPGIGNGLSIGDLGDGSAIDYGLEISSNYIPEKEILEGDLPLYITASGRVFRGTPPT